MRGPRARPFVLLAAPLLLITTLFLAPLAVMTWQSLVSEPAANARPQWSFDPYIRFFGDPYYTESLLLTFGTALLVALVSTVLAYPLAYLYWRSSQRARTLMLVLLLAPFYVNIVVKVFGWMVLLAPGGLVNRGLVAMHLIATPVDFLNGFGAVTVLSVHRCLPFVVLLLASAMDGIDDDLLSCARVCGATGWRVFRTMILPLSMPGVLASVVVAFSLTAAGFVIPRLVGGAVGAQFAPVVMYQQIAVLQNWRFGAAIGVVLLVASMVTVMAGARLARSAKAGRVLSEAFLQ